MAPTSGPDGPTPASSPTLDILAPYKRPEWKRSVWQVVDTALPLAALWISMLLLADRAYWLTLILAVPAAAFLIRLFIIQHDCGHGAFFPWPSVLIRMFSSLRSRWTMPCWWA